METLDTTIKAAFDENKVLGHILTTIIEGGKILAQGHNVEMLLGMQPGILSFEILESIEDVRGLNPTDLVIVEERSVDELWQMSHLSSAKVIHYSNQEFDSALYEARTNEKSLRSAILSLGLYHKKMGGHFPHEDLFHKEKVPALFLDRDGVLLKFEDYLKDENKVELLEGIDQLIAQAHKIGMKVGVITNQSGIGRGWMSWSDYHRVTRRSFELLAQKGQWVDFCLEAPFHDTAAIATGLVRASLRKPRPGMLLEARDRYGLDLEQSVFLGDRATDLMAASMAGVGKAFLVRSEVTDSELDLWRKWPLVSRTAWGIQIPVLDSPADLELISN